MFQKPAFGATTSGFGTTSTFGAGASSTSSPFGGFKAGGASSAFGAAPAFGAPAAAQTQAQGGLFGGTSTTGGLFGAPAAAAAPAFGASTSGFGFGANTSSGGLFNSSATSGGLFQPQQSNTAFGAKPPGFGFGGAGAGAGAGVGAGGAGGGLFGSTQQAGTSLFGQQSNNMSGGGLFANNAGGFGAGAGAGAGGGAPGTGHAKYAPLVGTDVVVKSGASQSINIKHHCITCMKEYESKSLEELRLEDYTAGRKGAAPGAFGFQQEQSKPLFGATSTFGQPATSAAPSVFGGGALSTAPFGQTNTFSFGGAAPSNTSTTGLFGAQKPAFGAAPTTGILKNSGGGLFGAAASTPASTFGTNTSTFGFGSTLQNQNTGSLFGAKQPTPGFGAAPVSTGFGSFGTSGSLFGAKPLQTQAPTFGAPQPGVGSMAGGFGTSTSGGLFGAASAFGKQPASAAPAFGMGTSLATAGMNTGLGASAFGQNKPAQGFGTLGGGLFPQQPANNTFRTGLDGGLGGGIFGNNSALGGSSLGLGLNPNNSTMPNLSGVSAAGNVHEQILALAARPYGDSPLFKDLLPDSATTAEEALKPTNPQAQAAVLARADRSYRVTSPSGTRLALRPRPAAHDKKSLFDGLEQSDASLEDKLSLKPSRKRLVLRPNQKNDSHNHSGEAPRPNYRQDPLTPEARECTGEGKENSNRMEDLERAKRNIHFNENGDAGSERSASWLSGGGGGGGGGVPWSEKEHPIQDNTPRLYPDLDKDLQTSVSERRSSWLTTKSLRAPPAPPADSAETSVRELAVRPPPAPAPAPADKVDAGSAVEEEAVSAPAPAPHPAGVKCTRLGYYTIPSLEDITKYLRPDGTCKVPHLTIGRTNYGNVYYDSEVDVRGLDIDALVHFLNKEVIVYPVDADKPPVGQGLNRRAIVTLDRVWPRDKTEKRPIDDPQRLVKLEYEGKLRRVCDKHDTKFIEYRPQTGSWVFRVEHFSKYGLSESDEEEDPTPDVLRRQLVQQSAAPAPVSVGKPLAAASGGLGGLGLSGGGLISTEDSIFAMQQSSLNLLSGASRAFNMDTADENTESHSMYQDSRALSVKSPTSELARLEHRQSGHLQLMKASLYAQADMKEDVSVSSGDQLVPLSAPPASRPASASASASGAGPLLSARGALRHLDEDDESTPTEEVQMTPLMLQPHTIVLRYHRKVPPFKRTIAGGAGAACVADMSVCRARHSRAGFGPGNVLVYATTHAALRARARDAELNELSSYVGGRGDDDWSEPAVARLALSTSHTRFNQQEVVSRHLESLFEFSTFTEVDDSSTCPRLQLVDTPRERYAALQQLIRNAEATQTHTQPFGVSGAYCLEVWKLCDALWGPVLENDGVVGTSDQWLVSAHHRLVAWLTAAVADVTDKQLAQPTRGEEEDENDGHSARVWTLLVGGRVLDACRTARQHGDLNLAALLAQSHGDPAFRALVARQLELWRACGAEARVPACRRAALQLLAGAPPLDRLRDADWRQALLATARYLCPQVPSLEQVIRRYEALFARAPDAEAEVDLTRLPHREMDMQFPLPPFCDEYEISTADERRVLDLRYMLVRARALGQRVTPRPAHATPDPLDYSLCFVLGVWFGHPSADSVVGVADQLEASGAWHTAVHALTYLRDDRKRGQLIRAVLGRHAPAQVDTPELRARMQLLKALRIPHKWVLMAQAHRAKYEHLPALEAQHLVEAEQWNAAHRLIIDQLLPDAVLADDLGRLASLLERVNEAAARSEVSGWHAGGQALYHYVHVCAEIRALVSGACADDVSRRLAELRPRVAAACRALPLLTDKSPRALAARAEMGARLVQMASHGGAAPLAALLAALSLPPDCTQHAQHEITTQLAEQASELCLPSATSPSALHTLHY